VVRADTLRSCAPRTRLGAWTRAGTIGDRAGTLPAPALRPGRRQR